MAGESFLSAATYVLDGWGIASGVQSAASVKITPRTVWKLDSSKDAGILTNVYTIYDGTGALKKPEVAYNFGANKPVYTATTGGCTLTNAVKEVFYTVESVPTKIEQIGYSISTVYVDIIIQDTLVFTDKTFCKKTYTEKSPTPTAPTRLLSTASSSGSNSNNKRILQHIEESSSSGSSSSGSFSGSGSSSSSSGGESSGGASRRLQKNDQIVFNF